MNQMIRLTSIGSVIGMMLVLLAFLLETRHKIDSKSTSYLGLMFIGSGLLALRALVVGEVAFFFLESTKFAAAIIALRWPNKPDALEILEDITYF